LQNFKQEANIIFATNDDNHKFVWQTRSRNEPRKSAKCLANWVLT